MRAVSVQEMADRVAALMEERLRIRGRGLAVKLRAARGRMPRRVQAEAALLARAAEIGANPRLMLQIDHDRLNEAYHTCVGYLTGLGRRERHIALAVGLARSIGAQLALVALILGAVLFWRAQR